ncbi:hypothetical protein NKH77_17335 [Streptomyces sp. M19]
MPVTAGHIRGTVEGYLDANPGEEGRLAPFLELLDAGADLTSRTEFRGHATAGRSSWTGLGACSTSGTSP